MTVSGKLAMLLTASAICCGGMAACDFSNDSRRATAERKISADTLATVRRRAVDAVERLYLKEQLTLHHGRINATARAAGITERQLHKLMLKHELRKEDFKKLVKHRAKKSVVRAAR